MFGPNSTVICVLYEYSDEDLDTCVKNKYLEKCLQYLITVFIPEKLNIFMNYFILVITETIAVKTFATFLTTDRHLLQFSYLSLYDGNMDKEIKVDIVVSL